MIYLTLADIQEHQPMSNNVDFKKKVEPFIKQSQYFDLRPILGDEFYLDLIDELENGFTNYQDLWEGSEYMCGNKKYINPGLKVVLVYYSYARYIVKAPTNATAYDIVRKENKYSEGSDMKQISMLVSQSNSAARGFQIGVEDFLRRNSEDFPLYHCLEEKKPINGRIRISSVRK